jgi:hypothetical protein
MTGEIIAAATGLLSLAGGGIVFIWNKVEARFTHIEEELEKCRQREKEGQRLEAARVTVIELLWQEVLRYGSETPVLKRAKALLDEMKRSSVGEDDT